MEINNKRQEFINSLSVLVADHVEAMLAYWDKNLVCRFANQAYRVYFGKTREEMVDKTTLKELLGPLYQLNEPYIAGVLKGKVQFFERDISLPSGEIRSTAASYFPHIIDGEVQGFFVQVTDISKIKKSERALQVAQQSLQKLNKEFLTFFNLNPTPTSIASVRDNRFRYVNDAFLSMFSMTRDNVIGKTPMDIGILPEDIRRQIRTEMEQRDSKLRDYEIPLKDADGKIKYLVFSNDIIELEGEALFISTLQDVTQRKEEEDHLRKLSEFQDIILNSNNYSIIAASPDGIIVSFNRGAELMLGYDAEELINKQPMVMLHDNAEISRKAQELSQELGTSIKPGFDALTIKPKSGHGVSVNEWTYIKKDGNRITVELSVNVLKDQEGKITGYLGIAQDITESKQVKLEIIKAKEAAEQANRLKETFLANMSHEIRTPMNAIIGFTDLLLSRELGSEEKDFVRTIKSSGENLLRIINDILDVSKINAGLMTFEEQPLSIKQIFTSLNIMLSQKAKEKQIKLLLNADALIPDPLLGDITRLTQILINLTGNAIKFTEKGSVEVNARLLETINGVHHIEFIVKDTGIGISSDKLGFIFERFRQADLSTTRNYGGTGLGLSIVKHLVEMQGGKISVESTAGKGSAFTFILPFKPAATDNVAADGERQNYEILKTAKILLAEDNLINIKLVLKILESHSITNVDIAENGKIAVNKAREGNYDAILMDVEMPEMGGYEATQEILQLLEKCPPVIIMTAHAMAGEREKSLRAGAVDYISKPIKSDLLLEKLTTAIQSFRSHPA